MEEHCTASASSSASGERRRRRRGPLLCGLPDDIAISCLARIPRRWHGALRCVSRDWRDLIGSKQWYSYRRQHKLDETWIYALCRDRDKCDQIHLYVLDPTSSSTWELIQGIPPRLSKRKGVGMEALNDKIYLLGGCGWCEDASDEVYCYDASCDSWTEAPPLSIARCYFACQVLDDKMFAIGGLGSNLSDPNSWDTFDPHLNAWNSHSDPNLVPEIEDSVVFDGKIYIRCGASHVSSHVYAIVYEPFNGGSWQHADADMASGWRGPAVVIDGRLYVLDQSSGTRLIMWLNETKEWVVVKRLSHFLTQPPCRLVALGNRIFVIGKGLSTVIFDVDENTNNGGVMVGSSISKMTSSNCDVISCKLLSL